MRYSPTLLERCMVMSGHMMWLGLMFITTELAIAWKFGIIGWAL